MNFETKLYLASLYDIYYDLFTKRQQEIFELFVEEDYTFSEIATYLNVSLPAISKSIKEISNKLLYLENSLNIAATYKYNVELLEKNNISRDIIEQLK